MGFQKVFISVQIGKYDIKIRRFYNSKKYPFKNCPKLHPGK